MKKGIKNILTYIFNPFAKKLGYRKENSINRRSDFYDKNSLLQTFYSNLKSLDFIPRHIVDVGAHHGTWTRETLKYFPDACYTLLEPQYWLAESIKDLTSNNPKIKFHGVGAGAAPGTFKFTIVDRDDSCTFRYTEEEAMKAGFKQIEVPVVTLNQLLKDSGLPVPDIIKIDAEGLDLEVLNGADTFFGKTEIFMVEAAVMNRTFDNSVSKMMVFMDQNGYRLFDLTDLNRTMKHNALWLVELVFIKKGGFIDNKINSYN